MEREQTKRRVDREGMNARGSAMVGRTSEGGFAENANENGLRLYEDRLQRVPRTEDRGERGLLVEAEQASGIGFVTSGRKVSLRRKGWNDCASRGRIVRRKEVEE